MSKILTYQDLALPTYINTNQNAVRFRVSVPKEGGKDGKREKKTVGLSLPDVVLAAELAGLNMLLVSDTGGGKTQLMTDIAMNHFGGYSEGGNANWADGRPEFDLGELFEHTKVDMSQGFDSKEMRQVDKDRTGRMFFGVDELNRAPGPRQNEFFDLADGKFTLLGNRLELGRERYSIFMATANLNRQNGDFSGTFELDRALLGRAHVTFDMDNPNFRLTAEDELILEERAANPRVVVAQPQDLGEQILKINKELRAATREFNPYFAALRYLIGRSLDYCETQQPDHDKRAQFPALCGECTFPGQDTCSLLKGSSPRAISAVRALANAFSYVLELKYGDDVEVDPFDAALGAFKFTTYHGNLNDAIVADHHGQKQRVMDQAVEELRRGTQIIAPHIDQMLNSGGDDGTYLVYTHPEQGELRVRNDEEHRAALTDQGLTYQVVSLEADLREKGFGTDWVQPFAKDLKRRYHESQGGT